PASTAFTDLPEYWSCPVCQTTKEGILKLDSKE
ncbi:TPA: rubredoxin, partial [Escherichia coli]